MCVCVCVCVLDSSPAQCRCAVDSFISGGSGLLREWGRGKGGRRRVREKGCFCNDFCCLFWLFSPFIPPYNTQQSQNTGYIPATLCHNVTVSPPVFDIQRYISHMVLCLCDVWGEPELQDLDRASRESRFRSEIVVRFKACDNPELITEKGGLQF